MSTNSQPLNASPDDFMDLADAANTAHPKILLIGRPKTGKTRFIGTYTRGPIYMDSFDPGGHNTLRRSANPNIKIAHWQDNFTEKPAKPSAWETFYASLRKREESGFFDMIAEQNGIWAIESTTMIAQAIMDFVLYQDKKAAWMDKHGEKARLSQQMWGRGQSLMQILIQAACAVPCTVVMSAHVRYDKNELSGELFGFPTAVGRAQGPTLGGWFDEVYYFKTQMNRYNIYTVPQSIMEAGTRFLLPENIVDLSMDDVLDAHAGKDLTAKKPAKKKES